MKKMKNPLYLLLLGAISVFSFSACNKDNDSGTDTSDPGKATVRFRLTDAPADYDAVYIDVQQIEVTVEGSSPVKIDPMRKGIYDLMRYRNGLDTLLVSASLPAGKIGQIRLVLGPNNSVVVDGQTHDLNTPSAQTSGLKLNLQQELVAGAAYDFWLDFDAGKSIVETGNGKYNLKPVIRAYSTLTNGRIKGYVLPGAAFATIYVTNGVDTFAAIPNASGYFMISGLPDGKYSVVYDASGVGYADLTLDNINVTYGQEIDLGTRVLIP